MINFFRSHKNKRSEFELCEDSKTSTVFEILSLFPNNILWDILCKSAEIKDDINPGEFRDIQFWPKWNSFGTSNSQFVEPDVLIEFSELNVIVEAKINNSNPQNESQWQNEISAYSNHTWKNRPSFLLIAIDGNFGCLGKEKVDFDIPNSFLGVYKTDWKTIIKAVNENASIPLPLKKYFDEALSLFGHSHYEPLDKFLACWEPWLDSSIKPSLMKKSYEFLNNIKY